MPSIPRPVEVLHEGRWLLGTVLAARHEPGAGWRGLVTYNDPTVALSWYHWRVAAELRAPTPALTPGDGPAEWAR